jgi:hypothetical protein
MFMTWGCTEEVVSVLPLKTIQLLATWVYPFALHKVLLHFVFLSPSCWRTLDVFHLPPQCAVFIISRSSWSATCRGNLYCVYEVGRWSLESARTDRSDSDSVQRTTITQAGMRCSKRNISCPGFATQARQYRDSDQSDSTNQARLSPKTGTRRRALVGVPAT